MSSPYQIPLSNASANPQTPAVVNVSNGEWVYQRVLLIYGRAGPPNTPFEHSITIECDFFPPQTWPLKDSHFKALVPLQPGMNTLRLVHDPHQQPGVHASSNSPTAMTTSWQVCYVPPLQNPPLHLAILVAKDSKCVFDVPPQKEGQGTLEVAMEKFRMMGYMWQAFTAEQMRRHRLSTTTFRLAESWLPDTISSQDSGTLRSTAQIHIVRSQHTLAEILDPDIAQQRPGGPVPGKKDLFAIFLDALRDYGTPFDKECYVAGLILDTHWDAQMKLVRGHAALGGGAGHIKLGIFGSHLMHAFPRNLEEIVPCFMDDTVTDTRHVANDVGESGTWWKCINIGSGAMLHEVGHCLTCPHSASGIMARGFNNLNRTFMVKEPGRREVITPNDEEGSHWHRCDAMRFRYHPCFRPLNEKSMPGRRLDLAPHWLAMEDKLLAAGPAGISLIEIMVGDRYESHIEYPENPPQHILLDPSDLRMRAGNKPGVLSLQMVTTNQGEAKLEDVEQFLRSRIIELPVVGRVVRGGQMGMGKPPESRAFEVLFVVPPSLQHPHAPPPPQKPYLCKLRIHHGSFLDGIVFIWSDGSQLVAGGLGGGVTEFDLAPGEKIVRMDVNAGAWVDGVEVFTDRGRRSGWCGGRGGGMHELQAPHGYELVGIYGTAQSWTDSIGILYMRRDELIDKMSRLGI
ncbi:uncharacterized protein VTP21DRAFT_687 [Calcarisporiella thermophila]|uniref:uncharacterized protein n=1 Tax=Calcarisporiella thermophila TaxID=911321 RepID=UPI003743B5F4